MFFSNLFQPLPVVIFHWSSKENSPVNPYHREKLPTTLFPSFSTPFHPGENAIGGWADTSFWPRTATVKNASDAFPWFPGRPMSSKSTLMGPKKDVIGPKKRLVSRVPRHRIFENAKLKRWCSTKPVVSTVAVPLHVPIALSTANFASLTPSTMEPRTTSSAMNLCQKLAIVLVVTN